MIKTVVVVQISPHYMKKTVQISILKDIIKKCFNMNKTLFKNKLVIYIYQVSK